MTGLGACDAAADTTSSPGRAAATAPTALQTFTARPRQHLLFTAKPSAPAAEVEGYFKAKILPALARDRRIGELATYVDARTGSYIIEVELRTPSAAQLSLAVDVLSVGSTLEEAEQILGEFAKYFDVANAQQLTPRADLSLSRRIIGTVEGAK